MFVPVTLPALFTPAECDALTALGEAAGYDQGGLVGGALLENIRSARIAWLDDAGSADWVMERIVAAVAEVNRTHFDFVLTDFAERMQLAWYGEAQGGHFDWHTDIGDGALARRRKLTLVVQVSAPEAYEGGALETNADANIRSADTARGSATFFPAFVLHRVTPVTRGARHSLTTWVHGPAFR
ncbi:2OG-Fe(II) oxygenase [Paroceanicella profunda]|uniref:2OG-Fe(II) oxygenase n=1 Tax=Paroceanicella profunda TaxID=2579971 RepID=A0A5B8FG30_9RHOB|nr:2OG-Fe(II) oxygenase [Paroceanicella profunda]QDL90348.1 2OG-Fe(II) oxygenase [Paroceanicella profunda]